MTVTNVTLPTISGTAQQGHTLTTSNGTWTFSLDYLTYTYRWLRCDAAGANCVAIPGATSQSYLLTASDVGSTIRSEVTATEHSGVTPSGFLVGINPNSGFPSYSNGSTKGDALTPQSLRSDDFANLGALVTWAQARGTHVLGTATGLSTADTMTQVQAHSYITSWELDNEPYFQGVNVSTWAQRMLATAQAIKAYDSSIEVIVPLLVQSNNGDYFTNGTWSPWANQVLNAAPTLPTYIDGWAIHPYPSPRNAAPSWTVTNRVRNQVIAAGADKPFHVTEVGWSVGTGTSSNQEQTTEANQATYVGQVIDQAQSFGWVASIYIYSMHSWGTGFEESFGLYTNGTARAAATAFSSRT